MGRVRNPFLFLCVSSRLDQPLPTCPLGSLPGPVPSSSAHSHLSRCPQMGNWNSPLPPNPMPFPQAPGPGTWSPQASCPKARLFSTRSPAPGPQQARRPLIRPRLPVQPGFSALAVPRPRQTPRRPPKMSKSHERAGRVGVWPARPDLDSKTGNCRETGPPSALQALRLCYLLLQKRLGPEGLRGPPGW